jgi:hypothetical protein
MQAQKETEAEVKPGASRPPKTDKLKTLVTGFLIFNDSTHHKPKGRKMQGLGKHYSNCEKRKSWWLVIVCWQGCTVYWVNVLCFHKTGSVAP